MTIAWWGWALIASVVWGVHYNLIGKALTVASPITLYWLPSILLIAALPFYYKILVEDYYKIIAATADVKVSVVVMIFTSIIASLALYKAVAGSNATIASLIEISYPVFVALFAYLIFGENHLTSWHFVVGGMLILVGTGLVIYGG